MMNYARGQTLVEMIVVVGVVVLLVTGIVAGTITALSGAQASGLRSKAVQFAQEGVDLARGKRDEGWNTFAALGTPGQTYCVGTDEVFTPPPCSLPNIEEAYIRSITLELVNAGDPTQAKMSVDVVVTWGDPANLNNKVELKTDLTQWR